MAGRSFGPPPSLVPDFTIIWRNWLNLVYQKIYKRTFTIDLQTSNSVSPASNPMVDGVLAVMPVVLADDTTNESRHFSFVIPDDWIIGSGVTVNIYFVNISTQTGVKNVITQIAYLASAVSEVISGAGTTVTDTVTLVTGVAASTTHITGDLTIPGSALAAGDVVSIQLIRDAATDTCVGDVAYINLLVRYTGLVNHE